MNINYISIFSKNFNWVSKPKCIYFPGLILSFSRVKLVLSNVLASTGKILVKLSTFSFNPANKSKTAFEVTLCFIAQFRKKFSIPEEHVVVD